MYRNTLKVRYRVSECRFHKADFFSFWGGLKEYVTQSAYLYGMVQVNEVKGGMLNLENLEETEL